jgi:hypothetical protein
MYKNLFEHKLIRTVIYKENFITFVIPKVKSGFRTISNTNIL